jgi:hypothetical protein
MLCLSQDLQALGQEVLDEAHEGHPGAMDVAHRDVDLGSQRLGQHLERQLLVFDPRTAGPWSDSAPWSLLSALASR